ncbi:MAG TPA: DEAD/DEAH box helicase [Povalibacter sp.]|nr:DEAD/DEAH box helicase [Povalibacter sp.]
MSTTDLFHPAVAAWFDHTFTAPTPAQADAWPAIQSGKNVLIAAPTGSGKTLAAFLAAIDELVREGAQWGLPDETRVLYVSPLKALSNDIHKNLEAPLAGIREQLREHTIRDVEIRSWVRTGDTPQHERSQMRRKPPHIVVTTPESLYILLGSQSGRDMLSTVRTVIVDEIHAVAGSKRGSHLSISLERLDALTGQRVRRVGLSATQKPIEEVARFLVGTKQQEPNGAINCKIVDSGHVRQRDLAIELPDAPLEAVMSGEVWTQVYDRLAQLIREHRTTLVFVNTRRMAERLTRHLSERLDDKTQSTASVIAAHHGSLAKELRLSAEQRLKRGDLKALVATASLELGIDIGDVDLVCQLSSPRSINAFLQRVGRSGHAVGGTPKGRLFALSRDDLAECTALLAAVRRGELDRLQIPQNAIDVLSQQIVAESAARECTENELFELMRGAFPYRTLDRAVFDEVLHMLAEGYTTRRGRQGALIYYDAINHQVRGRKGARLTAITSGGAIPDTADYQVMLEPEGHLVGTVNEDFAVESLQGDVFQLGNLSYRIIRVERSVVRVEDARGEAPTIPFWLGEAPGRTDELSAAVSQLRRDIEQRLESSAAPSPVPMHDLSREGRGEETDREDDTTYGDAHERSPSPENWDSGMTESPGESAASGPARDWLVDEIGLSEAAASQLLVYYAAARAALGSLPTQQKVVFERFFDEAGGMQLVIHSPFGSRINRAWGLALRKRFCRTFNFELQAAATEDTIILSLTTAHSFELADVARYLHPNTARDILIQALLAAPMFTTRWRWGASIALALPRFRGGKKVPAPLARMNAEDLLASVFPDQVACGENIVGDIVVPDHPLVQQTVRDCLEEAMDIEGFEQLLRGLISGDIQVIARDLTEPSPLALEVLSARPYAFLDDAPLEERRTQAVMSRRWMDPESAADIGKLDPQAIQRVREEAWPDAASPDELHDALSWLTFMTEAEVQRNPAWPGLVHELMTQRRVLRVSGEQKTHGSVIGSDQARDAIGTSAASGLPPGSAAPHDLFAPTGTKQAASAGDQRLLIATERRALFEAAFPNGRFETDAAVAAHDPALSREAALIEIVRGRLEGLGPTTAAAIAASLGNPTKDIDAALLALETEGSAMRGQFEIPAADGPPSSGDQTLPVQWCDRRLLARIHRYTVKRLRSEIEPVQARDYLRFAFEWQRITPATRMQGPDCVAAVLTQLEGFEAPAGAWETEILPARIAEYEPAWLDEQCLAGRIIWTRLATRAGDAERGAAPVRSTPIALLARRNVRIWSGFSEPTERTQLTPKARDVAQLIEEHGASFFDEIVDGTRLLSSQVEEALGELVALGLVNSDSFGGLRALLVPADRRRPTARDARRKRRIAIFGMQDAGRWAMVRRSRSDTQSTDPIEHVCHTLLRRWGVVFWKLLEREADWLPRWRDMLMCLRRLEARGEIRGGRFIAGFSGEQFALPEAIGLLREARRKSPGNELISLSAADPLNLIGLLTPGTKLPSLTGNRVLYRDGLPIALYVGGEVRFLEQLEPKEQWDARNALLRRQVPAPLADLA